MEFLYSFHSILPRVVSLLKHHYFVVNLLWFLWLQCDLLLVWEDCQIWRDCVNVGTFRNHWMLHGSVDIGMLNGNRVECCVALWTLAYGMDLCECFHNEVDWYWVLFITGPVVNLVVPMSFWLIVLYPNLVVPMSFWLIVFYPLRP